MKRTQRLSSPVRRASKRASTLIETMLKTMERGLREPEFLASAEWETLFGTRQSMVVNLQKLVQSLGALPEIMLPKSEKQPEEIIDQALSTKEMALLSAWLADMGTPHGTNG